MGAVVFLLAVLISHVLQTNGAVTCNAGYEKRTVGENDFCRRCPHPKYSSQEATECIYCPAPNVSHDGIICIFCDDGFGYNADTYTCEECPPHHQSVDGLCAPCVNGYTNIGEQTCISCSNDLIADVHLLRCRCEYGKQLSDTGECVQCPGETPYSDGLTCKDCIGHANINTRDISFAEHDHPEDEHVDEEEHTDEHDHSEHEHPDHLFCSPCPFGESFNTTTAQCERCASDELSNGFTCMQNGYVMPNYFDYQEADFAPICASCPSGQKMVQSGLGFECVPCPTGSYKEPGMNMAMICTPCERHTYQNQEGMMSCIPCMSNTDTAMEAPNTGSIECTPCIPGTRFNSTTQVCEACGVNTFQRNYGKFSCENCPLGTYTEFKTGQAECRRCPGGTYGFTMEDGSNGCRRCEKEAVAEADGTISFTFAIGDVEGATSEADANCQSPNTVWTSCETIAAERCVNGEFLVDCGLNSEGTCQNCTTAASALGCVGLIQDCGGISAGCCGTDSYECTPTRNSANMLIEPLHSFRFTADNESLYFSWLDGKTRTYDIVTTIHGADDISTTRLSNINGLSTSIRYESIEFPCGSENPCLSIDQTNEWIINITIAPENGSPLELENVLYSVENRTFNLTDLAWIEIEDLIQYDVSIHITSIDPNVGYEMTFNNDNTVFRNPTIELDIGETLAFFIGNLDEQYLFDFYTEGGTIIRDGNVAGIRITQGIQYFTPPVAGMYSYVSKDESPKLLGLIRVSTDTMLFKWNVSESPNVAYIISGVDRYNPRFINDITPTIYAKAYDKIILDFSENVENDHPVEILGPDPNLDETIQIFSPSTSLPYFYVGEPGKYTYRCSNHKSNTLFIGNIIVYDNLYEVNISVYPDNEAYPYFLSGADQIGGFLNAPQKDIQLQLGDMLVMNTVLIGQNAPEVIITNQDGIEVQYLDAYNALSVRWGPVTNSVPLNAMGLYRYTCSSVRQPDLCPTDEFGNTRYRGLIYVGIPKVNCTAGSVPSSQGCENCAEGFRDATGDADNPAFKGQCLPCETGSYQDQSAQTECSPCAPGTYQSNTAQDQCIPCPVETFQNISGQTSCHPCPLSIEFDTAQTRCEITINEDEINSGQTCETPASRPTNGVLVKTISRNQVRNALPNRAALQLARVAILKLIRPRRSISEWIDRIKVNRCQFASDLSTRRLLQEDVEDLYIDYTIETDPNETLDIDTTGDDILSTEILEPTISTSTEVTTTTTAEETSTTTSPTPVTTTTTPEETSTTTTPEETSTTTTPEETSTTTTPEETSTTTTPEETSTTTTPEETSTTTTPEETSTTTTPEETSITTETDRTTPAPTTSPSGPATTTTPTASSDDFLIIGIAGGIIGVFLIGTIAFVLLRNSTPVSNTSPDYAPLATHYTTNTDNLPVIHLKLF